MNPTTTAKQLRCWSTFGSCPVEKCGPECPHYTEDHHIDMKTLYNKAANELESLQNEIEDLYDGELVTVRLSRTACRNLEAFIDANILNDIRTDAELDNPEYVFQILLAAKALGKAADS